QALSRKLRRHPDVDHGQVGPFLADEFDELGGVTGLASHLKSRAVEQARQALPQQDVVVGQYDPVAAWVHMSIIGRTPGGSSLAGARLDGTDADRCDRQFCGQARSAAVRAVEPEPAAERLDAVLEPDQASAA